MHLEQVVRTREEAADGLAAELQLLLQGPGVDLEHDLERPHVVHLRLYQLINHILSLHHLLLLFLCVRRVHRQAPGLGLELVGVRFDLTPQ